MGERVKVCMVGPKAYPLFNREVKGAFGGAEVDLYYLATELAKDEGYEVSFVVADYGQEAEEMWEGVRVIRGVDFKRNALRGARQVWRAMQRAEAAVYMVKTAGPGAVLVGWYCRCKGRALVYRTAHRRECDGSYAREHKIWGRLFVNMLRKADRVVVQNVDDAALLETTTGVSGEVIANGHRLEEMNETEKEFVLWVGRSAAFKRAGIFLELAEQMPEERFVMICRRAKEDTRDSYEQMKARAAATANVTFYSEVGFDEIMAYYRRAKVLVNTSKAEGYPNTFIQAGAAGTALLSVGVNPDGMLERYACGLSCRGDAEKLKEGLAFLLEDERYREIGKNARRYVEERHDIVKIVESYKELLREVAASNNRGQ